MRKFLYSGIAVLGAASIATAAVMSGSSSEECSISKKSCSARKQAKVAAVQSADAPVKIVPVANTAVVEKSEKRSCGSWRTKLECTK